MRQGRFESRLADDAARLNASVDFDRRLLPYDIEGSKAHAPQGAQRALAVDPRYAHPAYWAPFLLIGNWL